MFFIYNPRLDSQAERRRFDPGLPLHLFYKLATPTFVVTPNHSNKGPNRVFHARNSVFVISFSTAHYRRKFASAYGFANRRQRALMNCSVDEPYPGLVPSGKEHCVFFEPALFVLALVVLKDKAELRHIGKIPVEPGVQRAVRLERDPVDLDKSVLERPIVGTSGKRAVGLMDARRRPS